MKVGTRVKIKVSSVYYTPNDSLNPIGEEGVILKIHKGGQFCYDVEWGNGEFNGYTTKDLFEVKRTSNHGAIIALIIIITCLVSILFISLSVAKELMNTKQELRNIELYSPMKINR